LPLYLLGVVTDRTTSEGGIIYNPNMANILFLSPHLDDAVLSCGGLIYRHSNVGDTVTVLTVFAGDPLTGDLSELASRLHQRWGIAGPSVELRREEDRAACAQLGAQICHFAFPEAIYRKDPKDRWLYPSEASIFQAVADQDEQLTMEIVQQLSERMRDADEIYSPIGLGGHVDHLLTRRAVEKVGVDLDYYSDFPYAARGGVISTDDARLALEATIVRLSEKEIQAWAQAVKAYCSQVSTFWEEDDQIEVELREYLTHSGGLLIRSRFQA
jgi:LmbE family N-acetylglucosaminyl deacetylase